MPLTASCRLIWPSMILSQLGASESSKSAMNTFTLALSALITILRSTGPVISTRRSRRSCGMPRICQSPSRMEVVSEINPGSSPRSIFCCQRTRAASSSLRRGVNFPPVPPEFNRFIGQHRRSAAAKPCVNLNSVPAICCVMTLLLPIVALARPAHFHQKSLWIRVDETILNWSDLIPIALRILNKNKNQKPFPFYY